MPFKMIATRSVYRADEGREYGKGQSFTVESENEKNRLLRSKRAVVDETKNHPSIKTMRAPEPALMVQKVVVAEEPVSEPAPQPEPQADSEPQAEMTRPRSNRYRRNDLRAED